MAISGKPSHRTDSWNTRAWRIQAGQRGGALPIQEHEAPIWLEGPALVQVPHNQPEPLLIPQPVAPHDQPLALLPEALAVLPYRPRRMDPNPFHPPTRGIRGINPFANNDKNRPGANWRNHLDFEEEEEKMEEVLPMPYRMEHKIDHAQPEQGQNPHPINALNDKGALQRMISEMMEPEARRRERPTYRKPYSAYIDKIPLSPGFKPEVTISDLAALKQNEDEPAQDFITRFRKLKMKCRIPMEERHFIQMAQTALKISLRKRFDGMLFGDLAKLADKASKYKDCSGKNNRRGTLPKAHTTSPLLLQYIWLRNGKVETSHQLQGPYKATKVLEAATINKRMLLQKAIETPHRLPKLEKLKGRQYCRDVVQEGITIGRLKLAEKPPSITTNPFP
ncbi:unnamed protein product [Prunus armeniaca]